MKFSVEKKEVIEVPNEGLISLLDNVVTLFCANYIYTGKLVGVNDDCVLLFNPSIVYDTGAFNEKNWKNAQALPNQIYIMRGAIESFGIVK
jgi:hypothetical protein